MTRLHGAGAGLGASAALAISLLCACSPPPPSIPKDGPGLLATVTYIADRYPSRLAGGKAEKATADWLARSLLSLGLKVEEEAFPILGFSSGPASFILEGGKSLPVEAFLYSPPSPARGLVGPLLDLGWGLDSELGSARGKIVILHRRGTGLLETAEALGSAGALGILVLDPGRPSSQGFAGSHLPLPIAELGGEDARSLALDLEALDRSDRAGTALARLRLPTRTFKSISHNVIARIPGLKSLAGGPQAPAFLVGAHLDSVATPGAADNASGLACLLGLAARLTQDRLDRDVVVVGFGAEEVGEEGSKALVEAWRGREPGEVLILDTVGGGQLTMVYSLRAAENSVTRAAIKAGQGLGLRMERSGSENSDHLPFSLEGIPAAFLMRLPEEKRHTVQDRAEFIHEAALVETLDLALSTLRLLDGRPPLLKP